MPPPTRRIAWRHRHQLRATFTKRPVPRRRPGSSLVRFAREYERHPDRPASAGIREQLGQRFLQPDTGRIRRCASRSESPPPHQPSIMSPTALRHYFLLRNDGLSPAPPPVARRYDPALRRTDISIAKSTLNPADPLPRLWMRGSMFPPFIDRVARFTRLLPEPWPLRASCTGWFFLVGYSAAIGIGPLSASCASASIALRTNRAIRGSPGPGASIDSSR